VTEFRRFPLSLPNTFVELLAGKVLSSPQLGNITDLLLIIPT
jgi:hypothetical protein